MSIIYSVLLLIDGVIYDFVCYIYEIFYVLADINIFSTEDYAAITDKIYVILGLIMLFVLAYSLLKAVINPDDYAKGEQSITKLIPNVIISLAIIVLLPTVFEFAMNFQHAVLTNNTIYDFILTDNGSDSDIDIDSTEATVEPGRETAFYTFTAFFYPSEEFCASDEGGNTTDINDCKEKVLSNGQKWYWPPSWGNNQISLSQLDSSILSGEASFRNYTQFSNAVAENQASYTLIVSTVAGIFILYVLLNFCFDMAVRVIKLAFYQLIAPIPVICRILPGGKFKDTFNTWLKQTVSVYLEVFIRVLVMALSVFLIDIVVRYFNSGELNAQIGDVGFVQKLIIQALLIMAVVIFMKQAPKLIGDLFKLDTGGMKLGLMDKLAMGGVFAAGGAVGSLITSHGNPMAAIRGWKYKAKNKDFKTWGQEANYRLEKKAALAEGATRRQSALDRLRRSMGFDTKVESENRKIDTQVRELDLEIEEIKAPLTLERVKERVDGNSSFIKIKDSIEDRIKKKLNDEKSNYMAEISFDIEVEHNHGIDSQGNPIITKSVEHRTQSGNLNALRKYLQSNSGNMTTEQITAFNQQIAAAEKGLVSQYLKDNVTNAEGTDGATDAVVRNFVSDIRSSGVLDTTLMNSDGISELSEENRDAILHSEDLWGVLDDVGKEVSESISELNRQTANINQKTLDKVYEKQRLEGSKSSRKNRAYKASSDFSGKRPGSGK